MSILMLKRVNFGQKLLLYLSREPPLSPAVLTTLLSLSQSNAENPKVYMMRFMEHQITNFKGMLFLK